MTWLICIKALWAIYNYIFLKRQRCLLKYDSMRCFVASNLTPSALNLIFKKYYIKGWNVIVKPLIFYYFLWISFCFLWMYLQVWRTWKDAILPVSNLERKGIKFTWYNYILKGRSLATERQHLKNNCCSSNAFIYSIKFFSEVKLSTHLLYFSYFQHCSMLMNQEIYKT
jgi:hypothetical protein